jgi:hypothetical protein
LSRSTFGSLYSVYLQKSLDNRGFKVFILFRFYQVLLTAVWYSDGLRAGRLRSLGPIPGRGKIFIHPTASRPALGSTQPPIKWASGLFPRG